MLLELNGLSNILARNFEHDIADKKDDQANGVLARVHLQVFLHTSDFCIADTLSPLSASYTAIIGLEEAYFVRSMYESKYMIKMVGIRSMSMLLTNFFSSSGVYGDSSGAFSIFIVSESVFCIFSSSILRGIRWASQQTEGKKEIE